MNKENIKSIWYKLNVLLFLTGVVLTVLQLCGVIGLEWWIVLLPFYITLLVVLSVVVFFYMALYVLFSIDYVANKGWK